MTIRYVSLLVGLFAVGCAAPTGPAAEATGDDALALDDKGAGDIAPGDPGDDVPPPVDPVIDPDPNAGVQLAELLYNPNAIFVVANGAPAATLAPGDAYKVPCDAPALNIRVRYQNTGPVPAAAHKNIAAIDSFAAAGSFSAGVAAGGFGFASFSVPLANVPPNKYHSSYVFLDRSQTVPESNEGNNLFKFQFARSCPL